MSEINPRLQFSYATIDLGTCECYGCMTYSYEINHEAYIPVPWAYTDYVGKYYNLNGDQMWYWDAAFTQLWEECPSHSA